MHRRDQLVLVERLLEEIHGTALHGADARGHTAVARDEDDRQRMARLSQPGLQIESSESGHADVEDETGRPRGARVVQERLRRRKGDGVQPDRADQTTERAADARVVVDDVHGRLAHGGHSLSSHGSSM